MIDPLRYLIGHRHPSVGVRAGVEVVPPSHGELEPRRIGRQATVHVGDTHAVVDAHACNAKEGKGDGEPQNQGPL